MGQTNSNEGVVKSDTTVDNVQDELVRQARSITELAFITYEEFIKSIDQLNKLTEKCLNSNGKQLKFAIKKGTDTTLLWKGTVRIACLKYDPETRKIHSYRLLTLNQFLRVFRGLECQLTALQESSEANEISRSLHASTLMDEFDSLSSLSSEDNSSDCCICLERKPEVILPCAHCYCLPCIEQWNVNHKTCPICRETLTSTDETWVLYEAPDSQEINQEISSTLNNLTGSTSST